MNIQNLISKIRKARKIRQIFLFHDKPRAGIDVPNEDWQFALKVLASAFKHYKSAGCVIDISWWGEVFVTFPDLLTPFEMSIHHRPILLNIDKIVEEAKENKFSIIGDTSFNKSLAISVRPLRSRGKWKSFELNYEVGSIGERTLGHIYQKISSYALQDQHELEQLRQITTDDIVAVIRLGSVILGSRSSFHYLCNEFKKQVFISDLIIENSSISFESYSYRPKQQYPLCNKERLFLQKYLPNDELEK
jgi:hypothetical protein